MDCKYTIECLRAAIGAIENGDSSTALHNIDAAKDDILGVEHEPDDDVMQYVDDQSDDADALASAGFGTDEDYWYGEDLGDW